MQQQMLVQDEETLELRETFTSLQQEVEAKTKKLKKVKDALRLHVKLEKNHVYTNAHTEDIQIYFYMHTHINLPLLFLMSVYPSLPLSPLTPDLDPNDPLPRTHAPSGHTLKSQYLKVCPAVPSSFMDLSLPPSLSVTFYLGPLHAFHANLLNLFSLPCQIAQDLPVTRS